MQDTIEVTLQGKKIVLRSEESREYIEAIADFVNERINSVGDPSKIAPHIAALLAVLQIADELFKEREKLAELKEKIRLKSSVLLEMLDYGRGELQGSNPPPQGGFNI